MFLSKNKGTDPTAGMKKLICIDLSRTVVFLSSKH